MGGLSHVVCRNLLPSSSLPLTADKQQWLDFPLWIRAQVNLPVVFCQGYKWFRAMTNTYDGVFDMVYTPNEDKFDCVGEFGDTLNRCRR